MLSLHKIIRKMTTAVIYRTTGPESKLEHVTDYPIPSRSPGQIRLKVAGSSYNPIDTKIKNEYLGPIPDLPKVVGSDFSGVVEEADSDSKFKAGDRVWGVRHGFKAPEGTWTSITNIDEKELAVAPKTLDLASEAATIPFAGLTALQALRRCNLKPGNRVLIHAGAGGVGHLATQIAKMFYQAYVVTTSRHIDFAKGVGADEVVDYTKEDFAVKYADKPFNAILDLVGGDTEVKGYDLLAKDGIYSYVSNSNNVPGRKEHAEQTWTNKKYEFTRCQPNVEDLNFLAKLVDEGKLKPHIGAVLTLDNAWEAVDLINRIQGKIAIKIASSKDKDFDFNIS